MCLSAQKQFTQQHISGLCTVHLCLIAQHGRSSRWSAESAEVHVFLASLLWLYRERERKATTEAIDRARHLLAILADSQSDSDSVLPKTLTQLCILVGAAASYLFCLAVIMPAV